MFVTMSQLRNEVHSTDAEITDAVQKLKAIRESVGGLICNAAVDNAAVKVDDAVVKTYTDNCPDEPVML